MNVKKRKTQLNLKKWEAIIKECRSSSMKILKWLEVKNISKDQYYYWQRKLEEICCIAYEKGEYMDNKVKINVLGSCISRVSLLDGNQSAYGIADDRMELCNFLDKQNIVCAMMPAPFTD